MLYDLQCQANGRERAFMTSTRTKRIRTGLGIKGSTERPASSLLKKAERDVSDGLTAACAFSRYEDMGVGGQERLTEQKSVSSNPQRDADAPVMAYVSNNRYILEKATCTSVTSVRRLQSQNSST